MVDSDSNQPVPNTDNTSSTEKQKQWGGPRDGAGRPQGAITSVRSSIPKKVQREINKVRAENERERAMLELELEKQRTEELRRTVAQKKNVQPKPQVESTDSESTEDEKPPRKPVSKREAPSLKIPDRKRVRVEKAKRSKYVDDMASETSDDVDESNNETENDDSSTDSEPPKPPRKSYQHPSTKYHSSQKPSRIIPAYPHPSSYFGGYTSRFY